MAALECCSCSGCTCCPPPPPSPPRDRIVKRKLESAGIDPDADGDLAAEEMFPRVEIEDECEALREALASQQQTIQDLCAELEEERDASSTAANETMSMILRLQQEKAELQMEARQFKAYAEEKMKHDQEELSELEEIFTRREDAIAELRREIKLFKRRLAGCGVDPETVLRDLEVNGESGLDTSEYPPLKCGAPGYFEDGEDEFDFHRYGSGEVADVWSDLEEERVCEMERSNGGKQDKEVVVGNLPAKGSNTVGEVVEEFPDSVEHNSDDGGDDTSDRIYTIDAVHEPNLGESTVTRSTSVEEAEIKKLYMRLHALEADKESLKETIISMRADSTQLDLLKAIAQNLSKGIPQPISEQDQSSTKKPSLFDNSNGTSLSKWARLFRLWKKKNAPCRYSFGPSNNNPGLLLLVTRPQSSSSGPRRCVSRRLV